jgi:RNA polymerase sigma factor (sigma-70 family)
MTGDSTRSSNFPPTQLTVLQRLREGSEDERREAFNMIAATYWRAVYTYVRLHWRLPPEDAEDTTQSFLSAAWTKGFFDRYDPHRSRFRTFVRTCVDRIVQNERRAATAAKRGGTATTLSLDFAPVEEHLPTSDPALSNNPEELFRHEYVRSLFSNAVRQLQVELEAGNRHAVFAVFDRYDLGPSTGASYADVAQELALTVGQVTNHLHAARKRFRAIMLSQLRELSSSDEEFRAEAKDILGIDLS